MSVQAQPLGLIVIFGLTVLLFVGIFGVLWWMLTHWQDDSEGDS